jgi:tetratricopeptide (TPR) repeat protein
MKAFHVRRLAVLALVGGAIFAGIVFDPKAIPPAPAPASVPKVDARALALAPHHGTETIDTQIIGAQETAAHAKADDPRPLEKLGWLFVQKARVSNDPGYYKLAEQCGLAIEQTAPDQPDALLLRGHAAEAMHRFHEAEAIGRKLVAQREYVLDFALLGDALMEQGRLDEAVGIYQQMADLKPCLQVYTRIAHMRWLKGDLEGAIEMAEEAAGTGTGRDPEPLVWAMTKLAAYRFENGDFAKATAIVDGALARLPHSAAALLLRGRILLAQDRATEALESLREAARLNPLPDPQWTLAEALHAAGQEPEAVAIDKLLAARGAVEDPRTYSLYLATRGQQPDEALRLAKQELTQRQDVFTYDALAWASFAAGHYEDARASSRKALAEGTHDARLQLHAGLIAAQAGAAEASALLQAAHAARQTLLPSERQALDQALGGRLSQK